MAHKHANILLAMSSLYISTNLYDCANAALAEKDENQNRVGTAAILPPMHAPFRWVEVLSSWVEEEAGYDHRRRAAAVAAIYDDCTVEVNAETSGAAENSRSRTYSPEQEEEDVTASAEAMITCRLEVEDVG